MHGKREPDGGTDRQGTDRQARRPLPARPRLDDGPGTAAAGAHHSAGPQGQGRVRDGPATARSRSPPSRQRSHRQHSRGGLPLHAAPVRERVPGTLRRADDGQPEQADRSSPGVHGQPYVGHGPSAGRQFRPVIRESAASVIFTHAHPSGDPTPQPRGRGHHPPAPPGGRGDGSPGPRPCRPADTAVSFSFAREGLL